MTTYNCWGEATQLGKAPNDLAERKRGLPLVLAMREDPPAGALLAPHVDDAEATRQLYKLLENLEVGRSLRPWLREPPMRL